MKKKLFKLLCTVDKESSRFLNKLKNLINPLEDVKVPFCSPPTVCSAFTSSCHPVSGIDVKCYILEQDESLRGINASTGLPWVAKGAGWVQGASFCADEKYGIPRGCLVGIVFDNMQELHKLLGQTKRLVLISGNEFGNIATLYDGIVLFDENLQWGVSVDDIVIEAKLDFTQLEQTLDLGEEEEGQDD